MVQERQFNPNGRAAAVASRERSGMPGTPSRKEKLLESSALQDPGLKDYVREPTPNTRHPPLDCYPSRDD